MSLVKARLSHLDANTFVTGQDNFEVKLKAGGGLTSDANGLFIQVDATNGRGVLDPSGGTIALPTAAGTETTINNGTAYKLGDFYLVTSAGTIGTGITLAANELPAKLVYNGGVATADAGWTLFKSGQLDTVRTREATKTLTAGEITGGVTLSGTPTKPTETSVTLAGGAGQVYTDDFTVAGNTLTFTAAAQAMLIAGDKIQIEWI